jgi:hypothetical protein
MSIILNGDTGISGVDGSNTTPTLVGNDTNTGVFFPAADTVALATGGLTRFQAGPSGQLGIGGATYGTSAGQVIRSGGASAAPAWTDALVLGTAVTLTTQTNVDFSGATGVPSWAKRITVMFSGVSTNGTSNHLIQIGSGSVTSSGYAGSSVDGPTLAATAYTAGFGLRIANAAAIIHGTLVLTLLSGNSWVASGNFSRSDSAGFIATAGSVTLSGVLDRVRITTANGTDQFDAGSINIMYE